MDPCLNDAEKRTLLRVARGAIASALGCGSEPAVEPTPALRRPSGAFVSLHTRGPEDHWELRGCIGYVEATSPLLDTVRRAALAAAFHDVRFMPLAAEELPRTRVEISVLSPLQPLRSPASIRIGEHGLVVRRGFASGLLLPQVASEKGWDAQTFLEHTCLKAGLPRDAWRQPGTSVEMFSAVVFNEEEFGMLD